MQLRLALHIRDGSSSQALTEIQLSLLHSGWRALKPGGCLVPYLLDWRSEELHEHVSQQAVKLS